jgi:hypothetical protein
VMFILTLSFEIAIIIPPIRFLSVYQISHGYVKVV